MNKTSQQEPALSRSYLHRRQAGPAGAVERSFVVLPRDQGDTCHQHQGGQTQDRSWGKGKNGGNTSSVYINKTLIVQIKA